MGDTVKAVDSSGIYGAYAALIVQAVVPILLGSFASVKTPQAIKRRARKLQHKAAVLDPDDEDDDIDDEERLSMTDSLLFPVFGSATLLGIFLIFKYLGTEWINWILGIYFACAGVASFHLAFSFLIDGAVGRTPFRNMQKYHLRIEKGFKQVFHLSFSPATFFLLPFSILIPALHVYLSRPWYLTNVLSFTFAHSAISMLKLDGFKTGAALLVGLFFYDIFWVFGTPVMVTVAKGLDAPIKVLAPKSLTDLSAGFSMLGLGDIVIPGIVISLALRYDYASHVARALKKNPDALPTKEQAYSKPYFATVMIAYVSGLMTTMAVMHVWQKPQPALLYLSPACIGSILLVAIARGELSALLKWSDEAESAENDLITEAKRIAAEDTAKPAAAEPVAVSVVSALSEAAADGDDDWMKLDETVKDSDNQRRSKKSNKKKK